jgi:hypothetical protein
MAAQELPTLYERLGGVYSIATVMDDLINRIMIDPRLNAKPKSRRGPSSLSDHSALKYGSCRSRLTHLLVD